LHIGEGFMFQLTRNEVDNLAEAPRDVLQIARRCCTMIWKGGANNA
jgi:hypothetical protein